MHQSTAIIMSILALYFLYPCSMVALWLLYGCSMVALWLLMGCSWASHGMLYASSIYRAMSTA